MTNTPLPPLVLTSQAKDCPPKRGDVRYQLVSVAPVLKVALTCMACADGYVMCRQAATYPKILPLRHWNELLK